MANPIVTIETNHGTFKAEMFEDVAPVTAGNFLRAAPIAILVSLALAGRASFDPAGAALAVASGALASGVGYAIWYTALPALKATQAATVQLSVPVLAALGGILLLGEPITLRLALASVAILGGIALVLVERGRSSEQRLGADVGRRGG